ncbi:hypothetical protein CVIRNUC_002131 [Coccomyxa viridis]|uniref:Selenoprotein O n=1 Tax=Coccomyxa viridis TaxID=1274662 RepID=A0AAV1HW34_9CHLO|nr:hypothetical protein CVIRNUC_002131 [Coccomyxa viridis]
MVTLEGLVFDNLSLKALPIDERQGSEIRQVARACYSRVSPTPLKNPRLVAVSQPALQLLDLDESQTARPEFLEVMAGNTILPGMDTAAHCYCGHQFGNFAGQLGDGAVIYLGEVVNAAGARWEVQLKGAGLTPFSRTADGRKVQRSSVREFLGSEAMHNLGIPTTRAGSLVTSDTMIVRDPLYSGNAIEERASTVLRIAPTFFRFGSFEVFNQSDLKTGRSGPSAGRGLEHTMLPQMLDHIICTFFPAIWRAPAGSLREVTDSRQDMYMEFYEEVCKRTAQLVAGWQCVGFCHGVLNTDNMSILGLTIDYGPYGFMDRYDPEFVPNQSDDTGRYRYEEQPAACYWNCEKLAEALKAVLSRGRALSWLQSNFYLEFQRSYMRTMRHKLGLLQLERDSDEQLVQDLLQTMHETGADFTNTFCWLVEVSLPKASSGQSNPIALEDGQSSAPEQNGAGPSSSGGTAETGGFLEHILGSLASSDELAEAAAPGMPTQQLRVLMQFSHNESLLAALGASKELLQRESRRLQRFEELQKVSAAEKASKDEQRWRAWLSRYRERLQLEVDAGATATARVDAMNSVNPRYVLRNWIAQNAITMAEKGDYSEVERVLRLLEQPFSDDAAQEGGTAVQSSERSLQYDGPVPQWAKRSCVSCSS